MKVTTIKMSGGSWEKDVLKLLQSGTPFKLIEIQTDADWRKVREMADECEVSVAESQTEAYFYPTATPTKAPKSRPPTKSSPDSGSVAKPVKHKPLQKRPKQFLVIEDSGDDAMLIKRAFQATESCGAFICRNLSEAKAYLQGAGMYDNRQTYPFPSAVICDMHLGLESGLDFLKWVKESPDFKTMPVIILTGMASTRECVIAKELGSLEVLHKPDKYEDLLTMVQDLAAKLCG